MQALIDDEANRILSYTPLAHYHQGGGGWI